NTCLQLIESSLAEVKVNRPYEKGYRYCRRCDYYLKTSRSHCECCGLHLRFGPAIHTPRRRAVEATGQF
ncbi:MAG TPA: hypothetical protein VJL54_04805, partial [Nitrososphaera sp.]|nr:hypothetical protein [Nitrososphaera sp.]